MARPLIARAIDIVERKFKREAPGILVIEAPTGYGKTVAGPLIFKTVVDLGMAYSFIHSLPLRAIVRDYYLCTLLRAIIRGSSTYEKLTSICRDEDSSILSEIGAVMSYLGINNEMVAYQMGERLEPLPGIARKEPFFDARYIVATLDSFIYNLFRVPVAEIFDRRKHYAIPRLRIFLSALYLDEAHMVFEESEEESQMFTSTMEALRVLQQMRVPVMLASATLAPKHLKELRDSVSTEVYVVRLGRRDKEENNTIEVADSDFIDKVSSIRWRTELILDQDVISKTVELVKTGLRVFIACDTVASAIQRYREIAKRLGESRVVLLHGLMTRGDRERGLNELRNASVLVATSVVEAGVNVSFDVLIGDGGRIPSIVQRAGRICRNLKCDEAHVYLVRDRSLDVVSSFVEKAHSEGKEVCWRTPFDLGDCLGYLHLLEAVNMPEKDPKLRRILSSLYTPLFISSDTIDALLERAEYALTRVSLIETLVGFDDLKEVESRGRSIVLEHSMPLPVNRINKLLKKSCVVGLIVLYGSTSVDEARIVCEASDLVDIRGSFSIKRYIAYLRGALKEERGILFFGLLIKKDCYVMGEGLKI